MLSFCFLTPKRHIRVQNRVVCRILRENRFGGLGCGSLEEPGKRIRVNIFDAQFRANGERETH